jgi:Family of unknown function (DUF6262)
MSTAALQTAAANQARRTRTEEKLRGVADAIAQLQWRRLQVTYPAIAARAGVSRTFLFDNPAARDLVTAAITRAGSQRQHDRSARRPAEASWQQRALNAEQALKAAHAEIRAQRARIGELLGQPSPAAAGQPDAAAPPPHAAAPGSPRPWRRRFAPAAPASRTPGP